MYVLYPWGYKKDIGFKITDIIMNKSIRLGAVSISLSLMNHSSDKIIILE